MSNVPRNVSANTTANTTAGTETNYQGANSTIASQQSNAVVSMEAVLALGAMIDWKLQRRRHLKGWGTSTYQP
jgi:hypothetical protein